MTPTGTVTTYSTVLSGVDHPAGIVSGPDGNLWVTSEGGGIGKITTSGSITGFGDSQVLSDPVGITVGPDGALWFANTVGAIGRITTAGVITNYVGMNATSGIAAGSDDALWFTNYGGNLRRFRLDRAYHHERGCHALPQPRHYRPHVYYRQIGVLWFVAGPDSIGRITTAGAVTVYTSVVILDPGTITPGSTAPVVYRRDIDRPHHSCRGGYQDTSSKITTLGGIAAGSDGALWFTTGTSIGRITTTGKFSFYSATSLYVAGAIAPGAGGTLWFVNYASIGRITAGKITIYPEDYLDNIVPSQITAGSDGSLWFSGSGAFGHVSSSGVVNTYDDAALDGIRGIAVGPDGALWMSDNSYIARMSTVAPAFSAGPVLSGPDRVGKVDTCSFSSTNAGSASVSWLVNGTAETGATGIHFTPPGTDLAKQLSCSVTLSAVGGSLTRSSTKAVVVLGAALTVVHAPTLSGSHTVNNIESVSSGSWSPGAISYGYQWYLGAAKIAGATSSHFTPQSTDLSMKLHCVVTALHLGYANGTYTTPSVSIT